MHVDCPNKRIIVEAMALELLNNSAPKEGPIRNYNPCYGVELPKAKKYRGKVYDKSGIHAALRAAEGTDMYLPVLLLLSAGLRRGELAALRRM